MKNIPFIFNSFILWLLCGYRVSRFTTDPVKIGSPKELVLKKYGASF